MDRSPISTAEEAREKAIAWQTWASEEALSIGELIEWASYFEELADRFPELAEEYRENGII